MWSQDFKEFVVLLNAHRVEYLVEGGYAVGLHGAPRYTGDLDVWVNPTPENGARLLAVMTDFGFGGQGLKVEDFTQTDEVFQMGRPPFRIDVLTAIDGVGFDECYPRRSSIQYDGLTTDFIGLEDLRRNKLACGRPKDLLDLSELERVNRPD